MKFFTILALTGAAVVSAIPTDPWGNLKCPAPETKTEYKTVTQVKPEKQYEYKTVTETKEVTKEVPKVTTEYKTEYQTKTETKEVPKYTTEYKTVTKTEYKTEYKTSYSTEYKTKTEEKYVTAAPAKGKPTKRTLILQILTRHRIRYHHQGVPEVLG